jgi:hypothetical protein
MLKSIPTLLSPCGVTEQAAASIEYLPARCIAGFHLNHILIDWYMFGMSSIIKVGDFMMTRELFTIAD